MTPRDQLEARSTGKPLDPWQERMFILSSYLYYREDRSVLTDGGFDDLCKFLLRWWGDLSPEFRSRVSEEDLACGSGFALSYSEEEIEAAKRWAGRGF